MNPARSAGMTGQSSGPVMWVTAHGVERAERMTDVTCVKLVVDALAVAFPRSRRGGPPLAFLAPAQRRLSAGIAQFCHEVLRKATL
jgi:hypothetical protein